MDDILSTAVEAIPVEDVGQIEASDLTVDNLHKFLESLLPGIRSLAFNIFVCIVIYVVGKKLIRLIHKMLQKTMEKTQADVGIIRFLGSTLDVVLHIFMIFMIKKKLD